MEQQEVPEPGPAEVQVPVQEPEQGQVQVPEQMQVPERQRQEPGQAVQPREDWPRVPLQQRQ